LTAAILAAYTLSLSHSTLCEARMAQAGAAILDLGEQYVLLESPIQVACIDGELRILLL
jgi:hypothetical protein